MTDCVQFYDADGMRVEEFTTIAPQYKVVQLLDNSYVWGRLTKNCTYETLGHGSYQDAIYGMLADSRRVNPKKLRLNWTHKKDLASVAVLTEDEISAGPQGKSMFFAVDGTACLCSAVAVWKLGLEGRETYFVSRQLEEGKWVRVLQDRLYVCKWFIADQRNAIVDRLVELYRSNRSLQLYRFVAHLSEFNTVSILGGGTLAELVESAINYTSTWTSKAVRIGSKCIAADGGSTLLARPVGCLADWNVTQLAYLCKLELGEVAFLVDKGMLTPAMTGDEVWGVVKNYLEDPDRMLMREYRSLHGQS